MQIGKLGCLLLVACSSIERPAQVEQQVTTQHDDDERNECTASVTCNGTEGPVTGKVGEIGNSCEGDGRCGAYKQGDDYLGDGCKDKIKDATYVFRYSCELRSNECRVHVKCNGTSSNPKGPSVETGTVSAIDGSCSNGRCGAYKDGDSFRGDACNGLTNGANASYVFTCLDYSSDEPLEATDRRID